MTAIASAPVPALRALEAAGRVILHFYDLTCPFCYVGQHVEGALVDQGLTVVALPFQAHPEVPAGGMTVGPRVGPTYEAIAARAAAAGLPLHWQAHLPNARLALAAAEWARRNAPGAAGRFRAALFHAHFAGGLDIGEIGVLLALGEAQGVDASALGEALRDGRAATLAADAEALGRSLGVTGTPAWSTMGYRVVGLGSAAELDGLAALALSAEVAGVAADAAPPSNGGTTPGAHRDGLARPGGGP